MIGIKSKDGMSERLKSCDSLWFLVINSFFYYKSRFDKVHIYFFTIQFFFHEFDNKNIIYKFQTSYDINQLNLALEIDNLKLLKPNSESKYFLLQSF